MFQQQWASVKRCCTLKPSVTCYTCNVGSSGGEVTYLFMSVNFLNLGKLGTNFNIYFIQCYCVLLVDTKCLQIIRKCKSHFCRPEIYETWALKLYTSILDTHFLHLLFWTSNFLISFFIFFEWKHLRLERPCIMPSNTSTLDLLHIHKISWIRKHIRTWDFRQTSSKYLFLQPIFQNYDDKWVEFIYLYIITSLILCSC